MEANRKRDIKQTEGTYRINGEDPTPNHKGIKIVDKDSLPTYSENAYILKTFASPYNDWFGAKKRAKNVISKGKSNKL